MGGCLLETESPQKVVQGIAGLFNHRMPVASRGFNGNVTHQLAKRIYALAEWVA